MSQGSKEALTRLIEALQAHYDAAAKNADPDAPAVLEAESELQDAFFTYDSVLFDDFGVELPFDILMEDAEESDVIYDSFGYDEEDGIEDIDDEEYDEYELYDDDEDEDDELYIELEEDDESKE